MKQKIQLQIPEPCHENWNNMTATQQGRFCLSCQKEVIDFSVMTDKEILQYISTASERTCGRFGVDQLDRHITTPAEPRKIWWKYWMSVAASLILITAKSPAQAKLSKDTTVHNAPNRMIDVMVVGKMEARKDLYKEDYTVKGVITDDRNIPLPGANIIIKGTKNGTTSNEKGEFSIQVNHSKTVILRVFSVGFETRDIKAMNHNPAQADVIVNVKMRAMVMGLLGKVDITDKKKKNTFWRI